MTTEALLSTAITNLDATPPVRATGGKGGHGNLRSVYGSVTPTTGYLTGSTYRFARLPSNAVVRHLLVDHTGTITTMTVDITLAYSENANDEVGISAGKTGIVNSLDTTLSLFAHSLDLSAQTAGLVYDVTNQNVALPPGSRNKELWDAAGLTSDPGGFFDILMTDRSTMSLSSAVIGMEVQYTHPLGG